MQPMQFIVFCNMYICTRLISPAYRPDQFHDFYFALRSAVYGHLNRYVCFLINRPVPESTEAKIHRAYPFNYV